MPEVVGRERVVLRGGNARHARAVRLAPGEEIVLCDNTGLEYRARVMEVGKGEVVAEVQDASPAVGDPPLCVYLLQSLPKGDKMELVVQKGTELGASFFIPVVARRSIPRLDPAKVEARRRRWQDIALAAAGQSRRATVPQVLPPLAVPEALEALPAKVFTLILWEGEGAVPWRQAVAGLSSPESGVAVAVGPEGGWEEEEVKTAVSQGAIPVSLGRRILRTETAGLVALALLMYEFGDLG